MPTMNAAPRRGGILFFYAPRHYYARQNQHLLPYSILTIYYITTIFLLLIKECIMSN